MNFKKINMETWNRADVFRHFIDDVRCVMSLTVDMDITDFLCRLHQKNYKFYPTMMWVVSSAVNSREEFRMGYDEQGNVGIWDYVSPYYTHFHKQDEQFVKLVTEYNSDFQTFYQHFLIDQEKYKDYRGFDLKEIPPNVFDLSCLPWVHYRNFDMHIFDSGTYLAPVITWGKYSKSPDGRILMPLSMNIHHAAADGFHLCRFFSDIEYWMTQIT